MATRIDLEAEKRAAAEAAAELVEADDQNVEVGPQLDDALLADGRPGGIDQPLAGGGPAEGVEGQHPDHEHRRQHHADDADGLRPAPPVPHRRRTVRRPGAGCTGSAYRP